MHVVCLLPAFFVVSILGIYCKFIKHCGQCACGCQALFMPRCACAYTVVIPLVSPKALKTKHWYIRGMQDKSTIIISISDWLIRVKREKMVVLCCA